MYSTTAFLILVGFAYVYAQTDRPHGNHEHGEFQGRNHTGGHHNGSRPQFGNQDQGQNGLSSPLDSHSNEQQSRPRRDLKSSEEKNGQFGSQPNGIEKPNELPGQQNDQKPQRYSRATEQQPKKVKRNFAQKKSSEELNGEKQNLGNQQNGAFGQEQSNQPGNQDTNKQGRFRRHSDQSDDSQGPFGGPQNEGSQNGPQLVGQQNGGSLNDPQMGNSQNGPQMGDLQNSQNGPPMGGLRGNFQNQGQDSQGLIGNSQFGQNGPFSHQNGGPQKFDQPQNSNGQQQFGGPIPNGQQQFGGPDFNGQQKFGGSDFENGSQNNNGNFPPQGKQ